MKIAKKVMLLLRQMRQTTPVFYHSKTSLFPVISQSLNITCNSMIIRRIQTDLQKLSFRHAFS